MHWYDALERIDVLARQAAAEAVRGGCSDSLGIEHYIRTTEEFQEYKRIRHSFSGSRMGHDIFTVFWGAVHSESVKQLLLEAMK